jgi:hypothetical protein
MWGACYIGQRRRWSLGCDRCVYCARDAIKHSIIDKLITRHAGGHERVGIPDRLASRMSVGCGANCLSLVLTIFYECLRHTKTHLDYVFLQRKNL